MNKKGTLVFLGIIILLVTIGVFVSQCFTKDISVLIFVALSMCIIGFMMNIGFTMTQFTENLSLFSIILLMAGAVLFGISSPLSTELKLFSLGLKLRYVALANLGFWTLCAFILGAFNKVKKNTFVILGNKMLLPGQRYYLWPFLAYNLKIFSKDKDCWGYHGEIKARDGNFAIKAKARVSYDIPTDTKNLKCHSVNADQLSLTIFDQIEDAVYAFVSDKTASEIIGKKTSAPLRFDPLTGTIEIEFLGLSVVKP